MSLESAKQQLSERITKLIQSGSERLRSPHLGVEEKDFAANVISAGADMGQLLTGLVENTGDVKTVITTFLEETEKAEADPKDLLISLQEDDVRLLSAAMRISDSSGELNGLLEKAVVNGQDVKEDMLAAMGRMFQALGVVSRIMEVDFIDAMIKCVRDLRDES